MIDTNHQHRINYKILVDCYDKYEQGQAWTLYLLDNISCPFKAEYKGNSKLSIKANQTMTVLELVNSVYASEDDLECFMAKVEVEIADVFYEVPLDDLKIIDANKKTLQAVADWQFYINNF